MIEALGAGDTILASIGMTLPMLVAIVLLKPRPREGAALFRASRIIPDFLEGARLALANKPIMHAMVIVTITAIVARGVLEILPVIADGAFGRGAEGLGQLLSAAGAGALVSGIAITAIGGRQGHLQQLRASETWMLVGIVAVLAMTLATNWLVALALVFAMGASGTFTSIYTQSAIQLETGDAYRGRLISLWLFAGMGGNALGAILFGLLVDAIGVASTMAAMGTTGLLGWTISVIWARKRGSA